MAILEYVDLLHEGKLHSLMLLISVTIIRKKEWQSASNWNSFGTFKTEKEIRTRRPELMMLIKKNITDNSRLDILGYNYFVRNGTP